jgi:hypothetical protein
MLNDAIFRWDKTIRAELWIFAIQHAATIYNTTKRRYRDYDLIPWEQFTGECSKLDHTDMHSLFCPVYVLDRRMQEGTSPPKWGKKNNTKGLCWSPSSLFKIIPKVGDPKTRLVSPQFHVMSDDNFDTIKAPDPIRTSNNQTPWITYLKQTYIHMMIHLAMNINTYSLMGEHTYTQTV